MKKLISVLSWAGMVLGVFLVIFLFILQLQSNQKLKKELKEKNEEFSEARNASKKMEGLEKKSQELKQKEVKMKKRVVVGDTQPLGLIKVITGSAGKMGLRKISFELKQPSALVSKDGKVSPPPPPGSGPVPVYFQMKFVSTFSQALEFIKDLSGLERIVSVDKIEISRETEALPYQSVVLDLVTYYYPE
jgi:Tfp pilus assembly protein PilO